LVIKEKKLNFLSCFQNNIFPFNVFAILSTDLKSASDPEFLDTRFDFWKEKFHISAFYKL